MMIFGVGTNPSDVSIDTANSIEIMAGSHITEQHTLEFWESLKLELLNMIPYKPQVYDLPQNYLLDSSNNFKDLNILLSKRDNDTDNVTNTPNTNILNQENQEYYNRRDQQYIGRKYNGGLERVTIGLVPNIILEEEEEDGFYQWADRYDQWDNTSYTPVKEDEAGGSHTFNDANRIFNVTKTKRNGKSKTRTLSEVSESSNKSDFYISKCQS